MTGKAKLIEGYFPLPQEPEFINSGCVILDCVLGGGWPLGRISNVVGSQATGKTLLAIEACANFVTKFPNGEVHYRESEAAFDTDYAASLGMPIDKVNFGEDCPFFTVEDFFEDLTKVVDNLTKNKKPGLYIVDSLDALSDRDELERDIDKGTYGAQKAKKMSELFRRLVKKIEQSKVHLMIISQVRDSMSSMPFAAKNVRSGGRALDFYASQIIMLSHLETIALQKKNVKRAIGVTVKVKCTKNKIGLPLREACFDILFSHGIDRLGACVDWLKDIKRLDVLNTTEKDFKSYIDQVNEMDDTDYWNTVKDIEEKVKTTWMEIETSFMPQRKKYATAAETSL